MKPIDQTIFGANGNCLQACIASLLELSIEQVPQFPHEGQFLALERWLRQNFDLQPIASSGEHKTYPYDAYYLMWGQSPRGYRHSVIGFGGKIAHDPHPDRAGLETVTEICIFAKVFARNENEALKERVRELESLGRELYDQGDFSYHNSGYSNYKYEHECLVCSAGGETIETIRHKPDCLVVRAKTLLGSSPQLKGA